MKKKKTEPSNASTQQQKTNLNQDPELNKLGNMLVREGLLSFDGLQTALRYQQELELYKPLGKVCVDLKLISKQELQRFLRKHHKVLHLGEILVNMGLISQGQLKHVLEQQRVSGSRFGALLVQGRIITQSQLVDALSLQLDLPRIVPAPELVDTALLNGLEEVFFRKNVCLPIQRSDNQLMVVMSDPLDGELLQTLIDHYKCRIVPAIAPPNEILEAIAALFDAPSTRRNDLSMGSELLSLLHQSDLNEEKITPIAQFLLRSSVEAGATALHIESQERYLRIRFRVDGILRHKTDLPPRLGPALINCIKTPFRVRREKYWQEKITTSISGQHVELSVSFFSGQWGDNLVVYMLYPSENLLSLDTLGFSPLMKQKCLDILDRSGGMIVAASPIRNGKSALLYAFLNYLNLMNRSILTLETNIEQNISGLLQNCFESNSTDAFDAMIEAMTEYDSDVLMVSEIPDRASARALNRGVLFGKKVLAALTAGDSAAVLFTLKEMQADIILTSPVPVTIIAQKLVRQLCEHCRAPALPSTEMLSRLGLKGADQEQYQFYRAEGCSLCGYQGYQGMTAVHECLHISPRLSEAWQQEQTVSSIRALAREEGVLVTMLEDGIYKAIQGLTTLEELLRVLLIHDNDRRTARSLQDIHAICHGKRVEFI